MKCFAGKLLTEKATTQNRSGKTLQAFFVFVVFLMLAGSAGFTGCGATKTVASGSTWVVDQKYEMKGHLDLQKGATVKAPDGSLLTMTVNGVETAIQPGKYSGTIVAYADCEDIEGALRQHAGQRRQHRLPHGVVY